MSDTAKPPDRRAVLQNAVTALATMQARLDAAERSRREPIAVIGMGCRFPGGVTTPEEYWNLLRDGRGGVVEIPADRWDVDAFYDPDPNAPGKMRTRHGGFLDRVDQFDPRFFGMSPREATSLDPQQRLLLEVAWEALEDAAVAADGLVGSLTGVFVGITTTDYVKRIDFADPDQADVYAATGNALNAAAGRISFLLGFQGPCMAIDTACSSSLVAVHTACQSLRNGESNLALAAGVNVMLSPEPFVLFSKWGMLAPDGRCKTFDAAADGFVRGEGCGVVVLKRLSDAVEAGDRILAVIRGSAVNQDGRSSGLTVPNGPAQQAVIRRALEFAGFEPRAVSYVEAHGTATSLGDPIEVEALAAVYGKGRDGVPPLEIGSAKTNLGHTESASGVAGLMKVILCLQHAQLVPHLHLNRLNPRIPWESIPVVVPTGLRNWSGIDGRRVAAVSSFGFSGTNAHVIVEEAPRGGEAVRGEREEPQVLALSGKGEAALRELAARYERKLHGEGSFADLCFTANTGRTHFDYRLALVGNSAEAIRGQLFEVAGGRSAGSMGTKVGATPPRIAFYFAGNGAEGPGLGRELYETQPALRAAVDRCAGAFESSLGVSLPALLGWGDKGDAPANEAHLRGALGFAVQCALAAMWRSWGIEPVAVLGHGAGEYAAACAVGAMLPEDALGMLTGGELGERRCKPDASGADKFAAVAEGGACREPRIPWILSMTGQPWAAGRRASTLGGSRAYPGRDPAQLGKAFRVLEAEGCDAIVSIGTRLAFDGAAGRSFDGAGAEWSRPPLQGSGAWEQVLDTLARLYAMGAAVNWTALYRGDPRQKLAGPTYPFQRQRYWVEDHQDGSRRRRDAVAHPAVPGVKEQKRGSRSGLLGAPVDLPEDERVFQWLTPVSTRHFPFLTDHRVQGAVVVPATFYNEMAIEAATEAFGPQTIAMKRVENTNPLVLAGSASHWLHISVTAKTRDQASFRVHSRKEEGGPWALHVKGELSLGEPARYSPDPRGFDPGAVQARCTARYTGEDFYGRLAAKGQHWGPCFRGVAELWRADGEALSRVVLPEPLLAEADRYQIHPAWADAAGHVLVATVPLEEVPGSAGGAFVGGGIDELRFYRPPSNGEHWAHARLRRAPDGTSNVLTGDVQVRDAEGVLVAEVVGARLWYLEPGEEVSGPANISRSFVRLEWQPSLRSPRAESVLGTEGRWLILSDRVGVGKSLEERLARSGKSCVTAFAADGLEQDGALAASPRACQPERLRSLLESENPRGESWEGIVHLWSLDAPSEVRADTLAHGQELGCVSALTLVQQLHELRQAPKVWFVTRDAQSTAEVGDGQAIGSTSLWGFGRSLALEHGELWGGLIDLGADASPEECAEQLSQELLTPTGEDQIAFRGRQRLVPRLVPQPAPAASAPIRCRSDASYLITGGLGGLGLTVAGWLVERGARRLIVLGRKGLPPRSAWDRVEPNSRLARQIASIRGLESLGATVRAEAVDVGDPAALRKCLEALDRTGWPPIRGVVHAAGTLLYRPVVETSAAALRGVLRSKVLGGWLLHELLEGVPLDFFVLFSSASALLSSPWLAGYAAANAFLDGLAHYRRARELPALSVNWGAWSQVGMMADATPEDRKTSGLKGMGTISPQEGLKALERLMTESFAQVGVIPVDWRKWSELYPALARSPLLSVLVGGRDAAGEGDGSRTESHPGVESSRPRSRGELQDWVVGQIAAVLRLSGQSLDWMEPITNLGLDSMMAVELKNRIEAGLGVTVPMVVLLQGPSAAHLATELAARLGLPSASSAVSADGAPEEREEIEL